MLEFVLSDNTWILQVLLGHHMKNMDCWGKPGVHSLFIFPHWHFVGPMAVWFALGINGKPINSKDLGDGKARCTELQQAS